MSLTSVGKGAFLAAEDVDGLTPLDLALRHGHGDVAQTLSTAMAAELRTRHAQKMELEAELEEVTMSRIKAEQRFLRREQDIEVLHGKLHELSTDERQQRHEKRFGDDKVHRWYRVDKNGKRELLPEATSNTYTPSSKDVKKMLVHEMEDSPADGSRKGKARRASDERDHAGETNRVRRHGKRPSGDNDETGDVGSGKFAGVKHVSISSTSRYHTGQLTVEPTFIGDARGQSAVIQWYRGDAEGRWMIIEGATNEAYQPSIDDVQCRVRVAYTPTDDEGNRGPKLMAEIGPLEIEPSIRSRVQKRLGKEASFDVHSKTLQKKVTLLLNPIKLKVRVGRATKLKGDFFEGFKVHIDPAQATDFSIEFKTDVIMHFRAATAAERDEICLTVKSFCLFHIKKNRAANR